MAPLKGSRDDGFTVVELILVVAIMITLIALLLPVGKRASDEAAVARAKSDLFSLATALSNFFSDLDHFPSCNGPDCAVLTDPANNLRFLAFCNGSGSCEAEYPSAPAWDLTGNHEKSNPAKNNAHHHLVVNHPNAEAMRREGSSGYRASKWKGPYITNLGADPYGRAYIAHVGAMEKKGCPVGSGGAPPDCFSPAAGAKGWILSAGPNGILDTSPNATELVGDDIGLILFSR